MAAFQLNISPEVKVWEAFSLQVGITTALFAAQLQLEIGTNWKQLSLKPQM